MGQDPRDSFYCTAQVCTNGHVITSKADERPERTSDWCKDCGATTIMNCPSCGTIIRGFPIDDAGARYARPAFCHHCGRPYPWTEAKIRAAKDLAQLLKISPTERELVEKDIDELIRDTPGAPVAAVRFKGILTKAGKTLTRAFRDILVSVLSETANKALWS
jgi:hypothetical protein